jgi:tetratricopeptide (TPR) repeat protein
MEIERCPVCGWPAAKGKPCPRGCGKAWSLSASPSYPPPERGAAEPSFAPVAPAAAAYSPTYEAAASAPYGAPGGVAAAMVYPVPGAAAPADAYAPPADQTVATPVRPDRRLAHHLAGPAGIGGFLLLPVIGLIVTIGWSAWSIIRDFIPLFRSTVWAALTTPDSPTYYWVWKPLILFEAFAAMVMVLAPIALLVIVFRKRRSARHWVITFYVFCCVYAAIDSAVALLFVSEWLRSVADLPDTAAAVYSAATQGLYRAFILAAVWIPYFVRSRRVKNTFVNPLVPVWSEIRQSRMAAHAHPQGGGRLRAVLAVVGIVVVAGAAVFALDTLGTSAVADSGGGAAYSRAAQLVEEAEAAYAAGDLSQSAALFNQAIKADNGSEIAYHGEWTVLIEKNDLSAAATLAKETAQRFPASRLAWFQVGYTQEAQNDLESALTSYTTCLQFPQESPILGTVIDDALVHKRLDLVTYVVGITAPREAIAEAVGQVSTALAATSSDQASVTAAVGQVTTVLETNLAQLQKIAPPAYFAQFHSAMLTTYGDIRTACQAIAAAAAGDDAASLLSARTGLNDAIDRFNRNDQLGASLMNSYYEAKQPTT